MGKHSSFKRRKNDAYFTPYAGVTPLISHLPTQQFTYIEPCAGNGQLIGHLAASTGVCIKAYDIDPKEDFIEQADVLEMTFNTVPDFFITNPPWTRQLLHPMIEKLSDIAPTWLLFDSDWIHTKQSIPYIPRLRKIVSIGRLKWFPESKMSGKDNCQWHLFDKPSNTPTQFFGR